MRFVFQSEVALTNAFETATPPCPTTPTTTLGPVLEWLGRLRMLIGVPFEYLVPDDGCCRPETIRFFYIDRNWTDAAVDGAIASGAYGTRDRLTLQQRHADRPRRRRRGRATPASRRRDGHRHAAANLAGFLSARGPCRAGRACTCAGSAATAPLVIMRMERLAPAVMLVIFDDIPERMEIEEPRQGIQFGVAIGPHRRASRFVVGRCPGSGDRRRGAGESIRAGAVPQRLGRCHPPHRAAAPARSPAGASSGRR